MTPPKPTPLSPPKVTAVLLADGWHAVQSGTFATGAFALETPVDAGKVLKESFRFTEEGVEGGLVTLGPLTSIIALRYATP